MDKPKEIKNLKDLRKTDILQVEKDLRLERKKDHNMEIIQESLQLIFSMLDTLTYDYGMKNGYNYEWECLKSELGELRKKIEEINTDATL